VLWALEQLRLAVNALEQKYAEERTEQDGIAREFLQWDVTPYWRQVFAWVERAETPKPIDLSFSDEQIALERVRRFSRIVTPGHEAALMSDILFDALPPAERSIDTYDAPKILH